MKGAYDIIDNRISALIPEMDKSIRDTLQEALRTLRDANSVASALVTCGRAVENGLLNIIGKAIALDLTQGHFIDRIKKLERSGLVENHLLEKLEWIRKHRNLAAHRTETNFLVSEAETALEHALSVAEWFYCACEQGPKLTTIYSDTYEPVTYLGQISQIDPYLGSSLRPIVQGLVIDDAGETRLRVGANPELALIDPVKLRHRIESKLAGSSRSSYLYAVYALSISIDYQGHRRQARDLLERALDAAIAANWDLPPSIQLLALDRAAHLANKQADCAKAEKYAQKLLELGKHIKRSAIAAKAFHRLGRSFYFRCEHEIARAFLQNSLRIFETAQPNDFGAISWLQFDLGMIEVDSGELESGRLCLERSLQSHKNLTDRNGQGTIGVNLAFVLHKLGDRDAAHQQMKKAKALLEGENYYRWYLHFLARIQVDDGNFEAARQDLISSLKLFRRREDKLGIIRSLLGFSWLASKKGDAIRAITLLNAEAVLREEMGGLPKPADWKTEIEFIESTARADLTQSDLAGARVEGKNMTWEKAVDYALAR